MRGAHEICYNLVGSEVTNKLGWKGLPGINALAYYKQLKITVVKGCVTFGPGVNILKSASDTN